MKALRPLFLTVVVLGVTGCGSLKYCLPGHDLKTGEFSPVTLTVGERREVIVQRQGIAIIGGFYPGVAADDSAIVRVEKSRSWGADHTYIIGAGPGVTKVYYIPVLMTGTTPDGPQPIPRDRQDAFQVTVVAP